jgi:hypothetical protein
MHVQAYEYYSKIAMCIMIPSILFSLGSGATNLTATTTNNNHCVPTTITNHNNSYVVEGPYNMNFWSNSDNMRGIILGSLSLLSASLTTVYHYLRLGERQNDHLSFAAQFDKLARQIRVQSLLTETNERTYVNLSEFIKDASEQLDYLTDNMPYIPAFITRQHGWYSNIKEIAKAAGAGHNISTPPPINGLTNCLNVVPTGSQKSRSLNYDRRVMMMHHYHHKPTI